VRGLIFYKSNTKYALPEGSAYCFGAVLALPTWATCPCGASIGDHHRPRVRRDRDDREYHHSPRLHWNCREAGSDVDERVADRAEHDPSVCREVLGVKTWVVGEHPPDRDQCHQHGGENADRTVGHDKRPQEDALKERPARTGTSCHCDSPSSVWRASLVREGSCAFTYIIAENTQEVNSAFCAP